MEKKRNEIESKFKWQLEDIIKNDEEYERICVEINLLADKIVAMKGKIVENAQNLHIYLETNEKLDMLLEKIYVYSYMYHYQNMSDEKGLKYKSKADSLMEKINVKISFANSELMNVPYEKILAFINQCPELKKYKFTLEKTFRYQKYTLSEKEEKVIAEAQNSFGTGHEVFSNLDNVDIDLGFIIDETGKKVKLTNSNYIKYMNSKNRQVRKNAFKKMYKYFKSIINTLASSYKGVIKEKYFSSNVRGFKNPLQKSLYSDNIDEEFYTNFVTEIHKYLPLMYKYMELRNKKLGIKSHMYDIYVDIGKVEEKEIPYSEGIKILNEALQPLGQEYIKDLNKSFKDGWIDVYANQYKRSGAYQWGTYGVHPYVSLNYENDVDSVSTLGHELGHAMHSYYSNNNQEYYDANYPIFLAEIASTVNEVLVGEYFYKNAKTKEEKIMHLADFLNKVRTTIFRQTMFAEFEKIVFEKYSEGVAITATELSNIYYDLNKLYFGKNIKIDEDIKYEWARIPHFYTPFYVYKYATGLIAALYIANNLLKNDSEVKNKYLKFLSLGASDYPLDILKTVGVDITNKTVIESAFELVENKLNELEKLINEGE